MNTSTNTSTVNTRCIAVNSCIYPVVRNGLCGQHLADLNWKMSLYDIVDLESVYSFKKYFVSQKAIADFVIIHEKWHKRLKGGTARRGPKTLSTVMQVPEPIRTKLPIERESINHKFTIDGTRCYVIVGLYPDGRPGEIFLKIDKVGSIEHGMADSFSKLFSIALQHGIPLAYLIKQFSYMRFYPSGLTSSTNKDLKFASSIIDYLVRWMEMRFLNCNGHKVTKDPRQEV